MRQIEQPTSSWDRVHDFQLTMNSSLSGHEGAKPLDQLIQEWPDLTTVMKALQPHYVFVLRYLRTIPKQTDGVVYRTDAYVNGLYVSDVKAVEAARYPQLDQDYLVQWRDGRTPEVSYYSGIPKRYRSVRPEIWHDITDAMKERASAPVFTAVQ